MSFLDDTKNVGTAIWAIGIIEIIAAIITIVMAFVDDDLNDDVAVWVVIGIGELICAIVYFAFGQRIRGGKQVHNKVVDKLDVTAGSETSSKFGVITGLVMVVGYVTVIMGIFYLIAGCCNFDDFGGYVTSGIVMIILGIIVLWIYTKITDSTVGTFDKVMWIVLVIIFILGIIFSLVGMFGGDGIRLILSLIIGILNLIIYLCVTVWMFDDDVKAKFGM